MDDGAEPKSRPHMTADAIIDWDGGGHLGKLELVHGEVRAMSPASGTHALIQANLAFLIGAHLRAKNMPCRVGTEAPVQPQMHANDNVRAPDLAVAYAPPSSAKTFPDPMATISTLTEIMVVDSERIIVEVFNHLAEGGWTKSGRVYQSGGTARLDSISADLPVAEIYAGTHPV